MIGIDLVDIGKFSKKNNIERVFTENEIVYADSKVNTKESLAGIFAAKEAVVKACGLNMYAILRKEIEIIHNNNKPIVYINGKECSLNISISHDGSYAVGVCISNFDDDYMIDKEIKKLLPKRNSDTHKGTYGKIGFLGGSPGMSGSIYMASLSAMKSGAGLTYLITPESIADILAVKSNEQIIKSIPCSNFFYDEIISEQISNSISNLDVLALGPGMGHGENLHMLINTSFRRIF
mgnify:FL=1